MQDKAVIRKLPGHGKSAGRRYFADMSLVSKLTVLVAVGFTVIFAITSLVTLHLQRGSLNEVLKRAQHVVEQISNDQLTVNKASVQAKAGHFARLLARSAAESGASLGSGAVEGFARLATEDPDIGYVAFKSTQGKVLASAGDKDAVKEGVVSEEDITRGGVKLGSVLVAFSEERVDIMGSMVKSKNDKQLQAMEEEKNQSLQKAVVSLIALFGVGAVIAGFFVYVVARSLTQSLSNSVGVADRIASGDLTTDIRSSSNDEAGRLMKALRAMNDRLVGIVKEVQGATRSIVDSAGSIAKDNLDLAKRTDQQASNLEETAASMEEMTSTVKRNAENIKVANELAHVAQNHATDGGQVVAKAVSAMGELNESSKRIADIVNVINEISFQTNLLALNASVEAARAGEQGKGFAVVANEVRNLARRSSVSANEIRKLIEESLSKVKAGTDLVNASGEALNKIVNAVTQVSEINAQLAEASHEQTVGIEQVNAAIMQMDGVTQNNAVLVEKASVASSSMESLARHLGELVAYFKVPEVDKAPSLVAQPLKPKVEKVALQKVNWLKGSESGVRKTLAR